MKIIEKWLGKIADKHAERIMTPFNTLNRQFLQDQLNLRMTQEALDRANEAILTLNKHIKGLEVRVKFLETTKSLS